MNSKPHIYRLALAAALALGASSQLHAADISWDALGADDNWSTLDNWSDDAAPTGDDVTFNNTGGAAGTTVTNIVDTSYSIDSLNFRQDNTVNQTTSIPTGQTLTVAGSFLPTAGENTAVLFGQPSDAGTTASTTHITGLGTFTVNSATNHFLVGYANASGTVTATANMSGLSNFNATVDIFGVGRKGTTSANASRQQGGVLTLSKNSTITANEISVGSTTHINGTTGTHNNGNASTLNLGSGNNALNNLYADKFSFGIGKAVGNMNFAAGVVSTDTVKIRGMDTTSAVGTFEIGIRNMSSSSGTPSGTVNFGAGKVDALISTLTVGQWANGAGTSGVNPTGTFTMGTNAASTVTVTTVNLANSGSATNPGSARVVTGNLNVNSGFFSATTVNLATGTATANLTKTANLTVDGGTFRFGSFGTPNGTNAVTINFNSGTVASTDATNRTLGLAYNLGKAGGGTTVAFGQASGGTGTIALNGAGTLLGNTTVETVKDTTLGGAVSGAFSLAKTGAASLIINQNQAYSGGTSIDAGTMKMSGNKTLASGSNMNVGAAGTWLLDGTSQTLGELTGTGLVSSTWATSGFDTLTVGSGNATSIFGGVIAGGNGTSVRGIHLTKTGTGSFTLNGPNTFRGNVTVSGLDAGDLVATSGDSFGVGPKNIVATGNTGSNRPTLVLDGSGGDLTFASNLTFQVSNDSLSDPAIRNLAGTNQILGTLQLTAGGGSAAVVVDAGSLELADVSNTSTARNLRLAGAASGTVSGVISDGSAAVGIEKHGSGTWTLSGPNTYSGDTTVAVGTLTISQVNPSNEASTVSVASGAFLDLTHAGTDTVGELFLGGVQKPIGVYGSGNSGGLITGTGTITVTSGPPGGFSSWITGTFSGGSVPGVEQGPNDDPDNDGTANLLEFVLNGDPTLSDPSSLPVLDASGATFLFTFTRRDDSLSPATTQTFRYGSDLTGWTDVIVPAANGSVGAASITVTDNGATDTVEISIPKNEDGGSGKLFGRLEVTQP